MCTESDGLAIPHLHQRGSTTTSSGISGASCDLEFSNLNVAYIFATIGFYHTKKIIKKREQSCENRLFLEKNIYFYQFFFIKQKKNLQFNVNSLYNVFILLF